MATVNMLETPVVGFNFDNFARNANLASKGWKAPTSMKTGTTICAIVYADGVIMGADTRATAGSVVGDKECEKIHYLAPNMRCCGAGTAADCDFVTNMISSQVELHGLNNNQEVVPINVAVTMAKRHLFRYQGYVGAYLIIGGVDKNGPSIVEVHAHGSAQPYLFTATGSGSLDALAILESRWKPNLSLEEGKKLVRDAIASGVFNDLGSGSSIDLCVITRTSHQLFKPYEVANSKGRRQNDYTVASGSTRTELVSTVPIVVEDVMVRHVDQPESSDDMDTSL